MIKMNSALIKVKKESGIKSNELIADGTGIDTSTVSLHFSGKRQINVEQAKLYADFFKVHIIKILDKTIFWYNPKIKLEKKEAMNIFCYLKNTKGNYVGLVTRYLGTNKYKILNYHTLKYFTAKIDICYPITNTSHLDYSKYYKVKALINQ